MRKTKTYTRFGRNAEHKECDNEANELFAEFVVGATSDSVFTELSCWSEDVIQQGGLLAFTLNHESLNAELTGTAIAVAAFSRRINQQTPEDHRPNRRLWERPHPRKHTVQKPRNICAITFTKPAVIVRRNQNRSLDLLSSESFEVGCQNAAPQSASTLILAQNLWRCRYNWMGNVESGCRNLLKCPENRFVCSVRKLLPLNQSITSLGLSPRGELYVGQKKHVNVRNFFWNGECLYQQPQADVKKWRNEHQNNELQ